MNKKSKKRSYFRFLYEQPFPFLFESKELRELTVPFFRLFISLSFLSEFY